MFHARLVQLRHYCPLSWLYGSRRLCSSSAHHPVIDVSPILKSDDPRRHDAVCAIGEALRTRGYFYAQNVNTLPRDYIDSVYKFSRRIHALPIEIKRKFAQRDGHGAYSGLDIGQAELSYDKNTIASVRSWDFSRTRFTLKKNDNPSENRYPGTDLLQPCYVDFMNGALVQGILEATVDFVHAHVPTELYSRQDSLGEALMVAFAECLDLPPDTFRNMFLSGDFGTIRLLSYPGLDPHEALEVNTGISAHTDFEAFTLMHQDAPGLQFLPPSGEGWVDAPVRPGEFVVFVGDILERFTNGFLRATPHRVVRTTHPRMSIVRFNAVNEHTLVAPLEQFVSADKPARYSPVTMKTHMETTMRNLDAGLGSWDDSTQTSLSATYDYSQ